MIEDAREVGDWLRHRFGQKKICIVGHSWGSVLGTLLAQRYPEGIARYIGIGQFVSGPENERLSYAFVLNEAKRRGDRRAIRELERIGEPKDGFYPTMKDMNIQRNYLSKYGGGTYNRHESIWSSLIIPLIQTPEYPLSKLSAYAKGAFYSLDQLWGEVVGQDFFKTVKKLDVPVLITQGRHDQNTPSELARAWFDALEAPDKKWVWFEKSAHSPIKEEPEQWQRVIREEILLAR